MAVENRVRWDGTDNPGSATRRRIGYIAPNVHGYFFGRLLNGVRDTASARGRKVLAVQTHDAGITVFEDEPFDLRVAWDRLDAIVTFPDSLSSTYLSEFAASGRPVVTLYQALEGLSCPTVVADNHRGVQKLVDHLLGHGHREIAFVGRDPANADDWIRYQAYRELMEQHGLKPWDPILIPWQVDEVFHKADAVGQLRRGGVLPTAVMACTDGTALALVAALHEAGIAVPDDIAVLGFDDIAEAAENNPPLTTISQSFTLAGATACALALDALDGKKVDPGLHCTPVDLVVRESCGCRGTEVDGALNSSLLEEVSAAFTADLGTVLFGETADVATRRRGLAGAARRLTGLFAAAVNTPTADLTGMTETAVEALHRLVSGSTRLPAVHLAVRALARSVADLLVPGGVTAATRLEGLALDVSTQLLQNSPGTPSDAVLNRDVEIQRRFNTISIELVRRCHRDIRSLSWLENTGVRTACLGLWADGRDSSHDSPLRIVGNYLDDGHGERQDLRCELAEFPPASFLERDAGHPEDLVFLLPMRFDGSDWGMLALSGPLDPLDCAPIERFNHWAVMLTVALDQEQALRAERALRGVKVSEERYALAAEAANDGLWDWNVDTGTVYYSTRWKALLGLAEEEITATPDEWLRRLHPDDRFWVEKKIRDQLAGRSVTMDLEYRLRAADGSYRWMLTHGLSIQDENDRVVRMVGSMTDITDRKHLEEQLRHDAHHDTLTGLPNRTLFLDRLNQAIARTRRHPDHTFAVVFLDLDNFKVVNDSLGHQVGDEVLIQVAKRLTVELRATDTVSRFGSDEFVLLLDDVRDRAELPAAVNRLLSALSVPLTLDERTRAISVTAGIVVSGDDYRTADEYVRDADTAMYRAKTINPGSVVMFDEAMHANAMARLHLESDLDLAIATGQFELHYQPILRLGDRQAVGLEALIRWRHPERGLVPPNDFLPVAEVTGQARPIGKWTIRQACRQIRDWLAECPDRDNFTVSVNLSNCQFWDADLRATLHEALQTYRIPPSRLVFEVTEGVIMHDQDEAVSLMQQIREDGIKLHMDDFGTGFSSLSALDTLPVDALKIDRSFVNRMRTNERSRELVRLMITMGTQFGVSVIAEGIETEGEATELEELGCPFVQGYLFSRPIPADQVLRFFPACQRDGVGR